MFCYKCGNELPDGALFCNRCGTSLSKLNDIDSQEKKNTNTIYRKITETLGKMDSDLRLKICAYSAFLSLILFSIVQFSITTSWIVMLSLLIVIWLLFSSRFDKSFCLAVSVTLLALRFIILDIIHLLENEDYRYPMILVIMQLLTIALSIFHWLYFGRKLNRDNVAVAIMILYVCEIVVAVICSAIALIGPLVLSVFYWGWCAMQISLLSLFGLIICTPQETKWAEMVIFKIKGVLR